MFTTRSCVERRGLQRCLRELEQHAYIDMQKLDHGGAFFCHGGSSGGADGGVNTSGADSTTNESATQWNPSDFVYWDEEIATRVIDRDFADTLKYDASVLAQDSTYLEETDDGFVFQNVTEGTLAGELGFASGDIPLSVNGRSVQTFDEVLTTLGVILEETSFSVHVKRRNAIVIQDYLIR